MDNGSFHYKCPDNMPDVEEFTAKSYHKIPKEELQRMIRHTIFAVDENNARFTLAGVCFEYQMAKDSPNEDVITAVATDGRRLSNLTCLILPSLSRTQIERTDKWTRFVILPPADQFVRPEQRARDNNVSFGAFVTVSFVGRGLSLTAR